MARSQFASIEIDFRDIQDEVIDFVKEHLDPDDVFGEERLTKWARQFEPEEVFEEKALQEWARQFEPEEVFEEKALQEWAQSNGYVLGDN